MSRNAITPTPSIVEGSHKANMHRMCAIAKEYLPDLKIWLKEVKAEIEADESIYGAASDMQHARKHEYERLIRLYEQYER